MSDAEEHPGPAGPPPVDRIAQAERFLALHHRPTPLLIPNAWDAGSAKLLVSLGFEALATTSSGFAASLGRMDGTSCSDEALANATAIVYAAGEVPVSADLENAFGDDPSTVRMTFLSAVAAGLSGASVEDYSGRADDPIYDEKLAVDRVAAAVSIGHRGPVRLVVTARCENYLRGRPDLKATIARLQAYQEAGADVLYAPGLTALADIKSVAESVDRPVNVLALPAGPPVAELAEAGVKRISVGGAFAFAAYGALVTAARELLDSGTYGFWAGALVGREAVKEAFSG
ncbi:MAG TPA: isocitrate lyase/phosphoenolpyruvate mutase family protein [Acidimicrobiia bacterium]|nr:isocitrate lyase/phosphoenolpyruvate mutase family protein [Acidimicrobiia bacterium]